jgi:hypothetical protein
MGCLTRGIAELHVNWGGYQVPLRLPIDPDETHHFDHVVTVDMPLPAWGETKPAYNKATRPLGVGKDAREKVELGPCDPERGQGPSPNQLCPRDSGLRPMACSRDSQTIRGPRPLWERLTKQRGWDDA